MDKRTERGNTPFLKLAPCGASISLLPLSLALPPRRCRNRRNRHRLRKHDDYVNEATKQKRRNLGPLHRVGDPTLPRGSSGISLIPPNGTSGPSLPRRCDQIAFDRVLLNVKSIQESFIGEELQSVSPHSR